MWTPISMLMSKKQVIVPWTWLVYYYNGVFVYSYIDNTQTTVLTMANSVRDIFFSQSLNRLYVAHGNQVWYLNLNDNRWYYSFTWTRTINCIYVDNNNLFVWETAVQTQNNSTLYKCSLDWLLISPPAPLSSVWIYAEAFWNLIWDNDYLYLSRFQAYWVTSNTHYRVRKSDLGISNFVDWTYYQTRTMDIVWNYIICWQGDWHNSWFRIYNKNTLSTIRTSVIIEAQTYTYPAVYTFSDWTNIIIWQNLNKQFTITNIESFILNWNLWNNLSFPYSNTNISSWLYDNVEGVFKIWISSNSWNFLYYIAPNLTPQATKSISSTPYWLTK